MSSPDNPLSSLPGDFLDKSESWLRQLNANLFQLDQWVRASGEEPRQPCDVELLNEMFQAVHGIKGQAGMAGLEDINALTHGIENVVDAARNQQLTVNRDVLNVVFRGIDQLAALVEMLRDPPGEPVDCHAVLESIGNLLHSTGVERDANSDPLGQAARDLLAGRSSSPGSPTTSVPPLLDRLDGVIAELSERVKALGIKRVGRETGIAVSTLRRIRDAKSVNLATLRRVAGQLDQASGSEPSDADAPADAHAHADAAEAKTRWKGDASTRTNFSGEVQFEPGLSKAGVKAAQLYEELAKLGELHDCDPPADQVQHLDSLDRVRFRITSAKSRQRIVEQLDMSGVREARIEPLLEHPSTPSEAALEKPVRAEFPLEESNRPPPAPGTTSPLIPSPSDAASTAHATHQAEDQDASRTSPPMTRRGEMETAVCHAETVRVDIERLDELMDLAGQLVINKSRLSQIGEQLKKTFQGKQATEALDRVFHQLDGMSAVGELRSDDRHLQYQLQQFQTRTRRIHNDLRTVQHQVQAVAQGRAMVKDLLETINQFEWVSKRVQQAVMGTRMVPIGPLFTQFHQLVGDVAREEGKDIRLEILGEKSELDKRMIDQLSEPLTHIVRNSASHGIEAPGVREATGKPRQGTVTLEAFPRGNSIVIRMSDDGKCLDTSGIVQQCVARGILTEADTENMTQQQIHRMIWTPGMSTAESVTDVSGRGVGMDLVKSKIEELNGSIDLESDAQGGTTVTIKLPVTSAILPSLMVEIDEDVFAMPVDAVTEIVQVGQEQLGTARGRRVASVRGRVISLLELHDALTFHRDARRADARHADAFKRQKNTLVVVGEPDQELGLVVDHVIGKQDVVIKSLAENYKNVPGIAGAHILGDGRVSLILDIPALVEMVAKTP